jgi:hypothetical protein
VQLLLENIFGVKNLQIYLQTHSFTRLVPILRDLSAPALVNLDLQDINPPTWNHDRAASDHLRDSLRASPLFAATPVILLQHLDLFQILPMPPPAGYKHLVALKIETSGRCPSDLVPLIRGCQELVNLHVVIWILKYVPGTVQGTVTLPNLRRLSLETESPEEVPYFFERIVTPRLEYLTSLMNVISCDAQRELRSLQSCSSASLHPSGKQS